MATFRFVPLYPRMWEVPGEKCLHPQNRKGRITLYCARPKNHHLLNHLHDVRPDQQIKKEATPWAK